MATTILDLPELEAAQGQKYLTVNQAMQRLDALVNLTVFNRTQTAPPGSPSAGHRYIVAATATGAFAGQETKVAVYIGTNWIFFTPSEGWRAYDQGANQHVTFNGTAWVVDGVSSGSLSNGSVLLLGVNATPDSTNRLSVEAPGVLFDAENDDFTFTLNKVAAVDTLQALFQTGFSTRAQVGLLGDDDFTFKVTPDGSTFYTALVLDKDNGVANFPVMSRFQAFLNYRQYIGAGAWTKVDTNAEALDRANDYDTGTKRFTARYTGLHYLAGQIEFSTDTTDPTAIRVALYINGVMSDKGVQIHGTVIDGFGYSVEGIFNLTAADYVELYVYYVGQDGYVQSGSTLSGFYIL